MSNKQVAFFSADYFQEFMLSSTIVASHVLFVYISKLYAKDKYFELHYHTCNFKCETSVLVLFYNFGSFAEYRNATFLLKIMVFS